MKYTESLTDTIVAPSTPPGVSAIAVIRLSGEDSIGITNKLFKGKDLEAQDSHTIHFGTLQENEAPLDEVLVSIFKAPKSFTKQNTVEISTHGSNYIVQRVVQALLNAGARFANPGEFTRRAFLNGAFDLAQAEAIADLIHSDSEASHQLAINQMRGGFSMKITELREQLIHFASMIELELDFSEEDVEFASRDDLKKLISDLLNIINPLIESFKLGNVVKNGVPTVIAGKPNAGKSTLLNALLNEDKAIVSEIAGTTRDVIEDEINIEGVQFRFIDTAGIRETTDTIEKIGVERTLKKMEEASLILYMFDLSLESSKDIHNEVDKLRKSGIPFIAIGNKIDKASEEVVAAIRDIPEMVMISAVNQQNLDILKDNVVRTVHLDEFKSADVVLTNIRHHDNLVKTKEALEAVLRGIDNNITGDFLAEDIRMALHYLGEITGEITNDDLLGNIFSKFCIGK